jgi:23S rRNA (adenine2503-C2)-methyltransferase
MLIPIEKTVQEPNAPAPLAKTPLIGLSREELVAGLATHNIPAFRAKQIWGWVYKHGVTSFAQMRTLAKPLQEQLDALYTLERLSIAKEQQSLDGTRKWLVRFADGREAETVFIPDHERGTICISSQVGCTLACTFCHTGTQLWVRNLTAGEIVSQILLVRDALGEWGTQGEARQLTNVVLMGMGEPLYNYDNVATALRIAMDGEGLGLSKRRITLSTSGVVPLIGRVGEELGVNLAISLHAVTDDLRNQIVPLNRKYPLQALLEACRTYPTLSNARRITFEYVMLKDVNDRDEDARALIRLLGGIPAKINLIPFNPWPGAPYECSSNNRIHDFAEILYQAGLSAPTRKPRGRDILAACGQLKSASERERKGSVHRAEANVAES